MGETRPTEILEKEHEAIKQALLILEKICEKIILDEFNDPVHMDDVLDFITVFADQCHHYKEETLLFPAMEKAGIPREGGPLDVMLMEHEMGRTHVTDLKSAWEQYKKGHKETAQIISAYATQYIDLLTRHIDKENTCLFPMAVRSLSPQMNKDLVEQFEIFENTQIGKGRHEMFHELLHTLKKIYL